MIIKDKQERNNYIIEDCIKFKMLLNRNNKKIKKNEKNNYIINNEK